VAIYAVDRTGLLIVDPYNDFMSEGGELYEATRETAEAVGFYDNMRKLVPAIRAARIQVLIVRHHRWREGDYKGWKHMNPSQVRGNEMSGFANTDQNDVLDSPLFELGVEVGIGEAAHLVPPDLTRIHMLPPLVVAFQR